MFFLLWPNPKRGQIIYLTNIEPKDQVRVNLRPMFEETNCDITCAIGVSVSVLHDAPLDLVLLMVN